MNCLYLSLLLVEILRRSGDSSPTLEGLPPTTNQQNTGRWLVSKLQLFEPRGLSAWGSRYVLEENVRVAYVGGL